MQPRLSDHGHYDFTDLERIRDDLTPKQVAFCEAYLGEARGNGVEACRLAGYEGDQRSMEALTQSLLAHSRVRRFLFERMRSRMGAEEVLSLLASHARGTMEDFVEIHPETGFPIIDLRKAQYRGQLHLIKKLKNGKEGVEIELYDAQNAAQLVCRNLGLFQDNLHVGIKLEQMQKVIEALPEDYREGVQLALADLLTAEEGEAE